jgi:hypothetical protein
MRDAGINFLHGALNRMTHALMLDVWTLRHATWAPPRSRLEPPFHSLRLSEEALIRFAADPQSDLTEAFVRAACAKGDRCYGILDGERLAGYGWCSSTSTVLWPGVAVTFPSEWIYLYKAFTLPEYRGRRLHSHLTALRLADGAARNTVGALACVEIDNLASSRSCMRLGASRVGTLAALRICGRYFTSSTAGCRQRGVRILPV